MPLVIDDAPDDPEHDIADAGRQNGKRESDAKPDKKSEEVATEKSGNSAEEKACPGPADISLSAQAA